LLLRGLHFQLGDHAQAVSEVTNMCDDKPYTDRISPRKRQRFDVAVFFYRAAVYEDPCHL
jgi:hypothetical protein